jgi:hypothetical protein
MRKPVLFVLLALSITSGCLFVSTVGAAGLGLRWDQCLGDGGPINKTFACDTNTGSQRLVTTIVPGSNIADVVGFEHVILFAADATTLPAWWQFKNSLACRRTAFSVSFNNPDPTSSCPNAGTQSGGIVTFEIEANSARLLVSNSISSSDFGGTLLAGQEYYGFSLVCTHAGTVGAPSCAGCSIPMCFVYSVANVRRRNVTTSHLISGPANGVDGHYVTWQGGGNPTVGSRTGCPAATPTRHSTWGSVKSLYR